MSDTVIRVENLGKKYIIGHQQQERYTALRDVLAQGAKNLFHSIQKSKFKHQNSHEEFWALKDVSFEIKRGDRVGIIGRNGAGKSTLLKILSRITEPTNGHISIKGRVASLLEVGTGFHPELTGRENIYLNGAILGMSKAEIQRKFDEIVAFAEIEKFLDTPVKRYSSGMYVRLAFAVAAHLESEILVVDEVLAVGDAGFQKKCLAKMGEVAQTGRTILFVSHNMAAVRNLCSLGIALERGKLKEVGEVNQIVDNYEVNCEISSAEKGEYKLKYFNVEDVQIYSSKSSVIKTFDSIKVKIVFSGKSKIIIPDIYLAIKSKDGHRLVGFQLQDFQTLPSIPAEEKAEVIFDIDCLPLMPGQYQLEVEIKDLGANLWEYIPNAFLFDVVETPVYGNRKLAWWYGSVGLKVRACANI